MDIFYLISIWCWSYMQSLLENVAKISHSENDLRRSINCYTDIVRRYQKSSQERRNEVQSSIEAIVGMENLQFLDHLRIWNSGFNVSRTWWLYFCCKVFSHSAFIFFWSSTHRFAFRCVSCNLMKQLITDPVRQQGTLDPTFLRLQMTLAKAYLDSYSFERGIVLLEVPWGFFRVF